MAQLNKVLIVDTVLGPARHLNLEDALMLVELTGQEGISMPFFYDLTMARDPKKPDISPGTMIGTMARIGIAHTNQAGSHPTHADYVLRTGMILHFEKVEKYDKAGGIGDTSLSMYRAHLVPTFHVLGREVRFRIFENLSAYDIIEKILEDMKSRCPDLFRYNLDKLDQSKFPKMEYCVQFGESTAAFLARLMGRFDMYYMFNHDDKQADLSSLMAAENETLFIGSFPNLPTTPCDDKRYRLTDGDPTLETIADFQRQFEPKLDKMWFGNFNIIDPAKPPTHTDKRAAPFDLLASHPGVAGYAISESFPEPFVNAGEAGDYAVGQGLQQEEEVFSVSGGTKNPSILAGRLLEVFDSNEFRADGDYLVKFVVLKAYEHSYLTSTATDIANLIFRDFLFAPFNKVKDGRDVADLTVAVVNAGLNNYLQNQQAQAFNAPFFGGSGDPNNYIYHNFGPFFLGGITQVGITGAVSLLVDTVASAIDANAGRFSNTFVALPHSAAVFRVPSPAPGPRPVAYGPHTALVIGPDGIDTKNHDIFCDALGRVRVRFPWDPGPARGGATLPPSWTSDGSSPDFPLHHGESTCWVRVSEAWAGRHYGAQFLPRIGQEVIVEFIAGDPERPIITGRVYNADKSTTNLPFPNPAVEKTHLKNRGENSGVADAKELQDTANFDPLLSGIKTWSIPTTDASGNPLPGRFHLLRFSDKRGKEQYLIRSQHRLDITAFDSRYETIHTDRHLTVGGKWTHPSPGIVGDYIAHVFRDYHLHVGDRDFRDQSGNRTTLIEQNDRLRVGKDAEQTIGGNWSTDVSGQATIDANGPGGTIVLNATANITLSVGSSSIVITPATIAITSPMVLINSGGPPPTPPIDPQIDPPKDPSPADPGDTLTPQE